MSEKTRSLLVPQYMQRFSCIGSACEDSCCVGWRVNVDQGTYKKYNRVRHQQLSPLISKKITRIRSNPSEANYAKIKMKPDGACAFLSEERLCSIQTELGEDYLSNTCAVYPRVFNELNGVLEKSATVSCPEIARLALLNPDGIEFEETRESARHRKSLEKTLDATHRDHSRQPQKYIWELRIFTIQVLQNRQYSLADRLIILGTFYQKAEEYIADRDVDAIPQLIATYSAIVEEGSLKESLGRVPAQTTVQMELLKEIADERYSQGIANQRFKECYTDTLVGLRFITGNSFEDVSEAYPEVYETYYKPFMDEHEYILENYIVNYVYKNMFPFSGFPTLFDNYAMLVVHYALIKLHLIGISGRHQGLNTGLVIKLIQSFSKTVEHNKLFLKGLFDLLRNNGFATLPYMAILIKN